MKYLFIILAAFFILASCEKVIPLDAEVSKSKLVVNSMFTPDSVWKVNVSNSLSVVDQGSLKKIENATVTIEDGNGNLVEQLNHLSDGNYYGTTTPNNNSTYSVKVSANSYNSVQGSSKALDGIQILSIDTVPSFIEGERFLRFDIKFNDDGSKTNFYEINFARLGYMQISETTPGIWDTVRFIDYETGFYSSDPLMENVDAQGNWMYQGIFRDALFNGDSKTVSLHLFDDRSSSTDYNLELDFVVISLKNITQERFNYIKSYEIYNSTAGNPFAQPVQIYSNIENGFGIFAGYNDTQFRRDF